MVSKISLALTGDVMIGRLVNKQLDSVAPEWIWGDMLPYLVDSDLTLINLEAALTTSESAVPKVFNFKADPRKVNILKAAGVDVANLANNHSLDYDTEGLLETLEVLEKANILHVGAGKNLKEAKRPVILDVDGVTVGIIGFTDNEPGWKAGKNMPGTFYLEIGDLKAVENEIVSLREKVDILIATVHWGPNMRERPRQHFIDFAHMLVELGVDLFHGHSAHIFQGVENYRGKLILYDCGDFVDDYAIDPILRNDRSFLFLIECKKSGIKTLRLIPTLIHHFQVNRAKQKDAEENLKRMQHLSQEFNTILERKDDELLLRLA